MAKVILADLANLQNETSAVSTINTNNGRIEEAFDKTLSRDGSSPNAMEANIDINGFTIYNLRAASAPTEAVRKQEFDQLAAATTVEALDAAVAAAELAQDQAEDAAEDAQAQVVLAAAQVALAVAQVDLAEDQADLAAASAVAADASADAAAVSEANTAAMLGTKVTGPASATDNAAVRYDLTTGKLVQDSALVVADTTGGLSRTGGGGIQIQGTNTNDSPAAGSVGEHITSTVVLGSAVALTTGTPANVTSISLTAGDWNVWGTLSVTGNSATTVTTINGSIGTVSATPSSTPGQFGVLFMNGQAPFATTNPTVQVGATVLKLAATTTVYFVVNAVFAVNSLSAYGVIHARRVR